MSASGTAAQHGHAEPENTKSVRKAVAASAIGNATEWFDFGVYGYLAVYIGNNFLPESVENSTFVVFVLFAASFVVRPLGGLFFGPLGDRIGRKRVLAITIITMALATTAIGLIPSYGSIGVWAVVLLLLSRLIQGFSTGGEYAGAATFIAEYCATRRRGFWGSFLEFGTLTGFGSAALLSTALIVWMPTDAMDSWGWRIPFLVALPLGLIGLYLRTRLEETPEFKKIEAAGESSQTPLRDLLPHWRAVLTLIGVVVILNVADYIVLTFMPSYLEDSLQVNGNAALLATVGVIAAMMVVIVPMGSLSDRIGRKPMLITSCAGFLVFTYPALLLIGTGNIPLLVLGLAILGFFLVIYLSIIPATLPALIPTRVRYGGFAIGYNLSTSLFGGTAPAIATFLVNRTGDTQAPAYYIMAGALVSLIAAIMIPESANRELPKTQEEALGIGEHAPAD